MQMACLSNCRSLQVRMFSKLRLIHVTIVMLRIGAADEDWGLKCPARGKVWAKQGVRYAEACQVMGGEDGDEI